MGNEQDLFISHASADKTMYVEPLAQQFSRDGITYWLDSNELRWGDGLALKINEGFACSRYILLCLSPNFLARPWPESEMNAALSLQNDDGVKRVLPLMLNSKDKVFRKYPLLAGLAYRQFDEGLGKISAAVKSVVGETAIPNGYLKITVESAHSGRLSHLSVSPRASVGWLSEHVRLATGVRNELDTGGFEPFRVRWVLIDIKAKDHWDSISTEQQDTTTAIVMTSDGPRVATETEDRLEDIGVYDGIVFSPRCC